MSQPKKIRELRMLKIVQSISVNCPGRDVLPSVDVACPGRDNPHIITIQKFYIINDVAHAYCKEHDLFFCIDDKKRLE